MAVSRGRKEAAKLRKANGSAVPYIALISDEHYRLPLSAHEVALSREIMAHYRGLDWYHGGLAGRAVGDALLPAGLTGQDPRNLRDSIRFRKELVYITPSRQMARQYAEQTGGIVYRVAPEGEVTVDPTALRRARLDATERKVKFEDMHRHFVEFCCPRATVLEVMPL